MEQYQLLGKEENRERERERLATNINVSVRFDTSRASFSLSLSRSLKLRRWIPRRDRVLLPDLTNAPRSTRPRLIFTLAQDTRRHTDTCSTTERTNVATDPRKILPVVRRCHLLLCARARSSRLSNFISTRLTDSLVHSEEGKGGKVCPFRLLRLPVPAFIYRGMGPASGFRIDAAVRSARTRSRDGRIKRRRYAPAHIQRVLAH